ncbi:MAG TPA: hypothetical protein PKN87_09425 [Syntrophomonadaceae bacterium]|nr:hypothetical protein [Syntrophomonadaceae bacterium]HNX29609.1 hypothetical protein [Syntrophomonadaceae bacterium]HPR94042.1 hypothetical protein [Syntrophomonadaceae bacterium]
MSSLLSTGPIENAAANASTSTWVKVLNNNPAGEINAEVTVYSLNGEKAQIASSSFVVAALSSEYDVFEITDVLQYEVEIILSDASNVLVSVWGKDADANLVAAHRFTNNELHLLGQAAEQHTPLPKADAGSTANKKNKPTRRRSR